MDHHATPPVTATGTATCRYPAGPLDAANPESTTAIAESQSGRGELGAGDELGGAQRAG